MSSLRRSTRRSRIRKDVRNARGDRGSRSDSCGGEREDGMDVVPHLPRVVVPSLIHLIVACLQAVLYPSGAPKGRLLPKTLGVPDRY